MPFDIGRGFILDYIIKYRKYLTGALSNFSSRDTPIDFKLEAPQAIPPLVHSRHTSDYIALTVIDQGKIVYISSANVGWNDRIVTLEFKVDPEPDAILDRVGQTDEVLVAHWYKTVRCRCTEKERYI